MLSLEVVLCKPRHKQTQGILAIQVGQLVYPSALRSVVYLYQSFYLFTNYECYATQGDYSPSQTDP